MTLTDDGHKVTFHIRYKHACGFYSNGSNSDFVVVAGGAGEGTLDPLVCVNKACFLK